MKDLISERKHFRKKNILFIASWNCSKFWGRFHSSQVKQNLKFSIRNFTYDLTHMFSCNLSLRILGNKEILGKPQICVKSHSGVQFHLQK